MVEYGTVKALHALAERVGLIDTVNKTVPKQDWLPVGELAFVTAANRLLDRVGGKGGRRLKWELNEAAIKEKELLDRRY